MVEETNLTIEYLQSNIIKRKRNVKSIKHLRSNSQFMKDNIEFYEDCKRMDTELKDILLNILYVLEKKSG